MDADSDPLALIALLTERVEALERATAAVAISVAQPVSSPGAPTASVPTDDSTDPFWILNGIKKRVPAPGAVFYAGSVEVAAGPVDWQLGLTTDTILESDWTTLAANIGSLGNPVRLSLLHSIISGASSVAELSAGEGMGTTGQIYHHLNQLVAQGWLLAMGRGHYTIPAEKVVPLLVILTAARRTV